jgi:hypothetical protein
MQPAQRNYDLGLTGFGMSSLPVSGEAVPFPEGPAAEATSLSPVLVRRALAQGLVTPVGLRPSCGYKRGASLCPENRTITSSPLA